MLAGNRLLVFGESNGARIHEILDNGLPELVPLAVNLDCNPDTHTPVLVDQLVVALHHSLLVMSAETLEIEQELGHDDLSHFGSLITDGQRRVLALTDRGSLLLFELSGGQLVLQSSLKMAVASSQHVYSHPAIVGNRLYCIIGGKLHCLELY